MIVHPVITCGLCQACRAGEDMHCIDLAFPGITQNGGFAEYLLTGRAGLHQAARGARRQGDRPLRGRRHHRLPRGEAGRRAAAPGTRCAIIGVGGLGHIAVQVLGELCATEIIAVDRSPAALKLVGGLGADHLVDASAGDPVEAVMEITGGEGAHAVIDFVGEGARSPSPSRCSARAALLGRRLRRRIEVPAIDMIFSEIAIVGSLVGNYNELAELMTLAGQGA